MSFTLEEIALQDFKLSDSENKQIHMEQFFDNFNISCNSFLKDLPKGIDPKEVRSLMANSIKLQQDSQGKSFIDASGKIDTSVEKKVENFTKITLVNKHPDINFDLIKTNEIETNTQNTNEEKKDILFEKEKKEFVDNFFKDWKNLSDNEKKKKISEEFGINIYDLPEEKQDNLLANFDTYISINELKDKIIDENKKNGIELSDEDALKQSIEQHSQKEPVKMKNFQESYKLMDQITEISSKIKLNRATDEDKAKLDSLINLLPENLKKDANNMKEIVFAYKNHEKNMRNIEYNNEENSPEISDDENDLSDSWDNVVEENTENKEVSEENVEQEKNQPEISNDENDELFDSWDNEIDPKDEVFEEPDKKELAKMSLQGQAKKLGLDSKDPDDRKNIINDIKEKTGIPPSEIKEYFSEVKNMRKQLRQNETTQESPQKAQQSQLEDILNGEVTEEKDKKNPTVEELLNGDVEQQEEQGVVAPSFTEHENNLEGLENDGSFNMEELTNSEPEETIEQDSDNSVKTAPEGVNPILTGGIDELQDEQENSVQEQPKQNRFIAFLKNIQKRFENRNVAKLTDGNNPQPRKSFIDRVQSAFAGLRNNARNEQQGKVAPITPTVSTQDAKKSDPFALSAEMRAQINENSINIAQQSQTKSTKSKGALNIQVAGNENGIKQDEKNNSEQFR